MALDIPALSPTGQTLKYVRAAYDFERDGGVQGTIHIPSQQLPSGAVVVGIGAMVVTPCTSLGTPTILVRLGPNIVDSLPSPIDAATMATFPVGSAVPQTESAWPVSIDITEADLTAGSFYIYVFYV
jgi:hypothetical protein